MRYFKHIPSYLRQQIIMRHGGWIEPDAPFTVLEIGAPATVSPGDSTVKNTAMRVEIGDYIAMVHYDRVDIQTFWTSIAAAANLTRKLVISTPTMVNTHEILDDINNYTGFDFSPDEIENLPILDGTLTSVIVKTTPKCLWFTGQLILPLHFPLLKWSHVPIQQLSVVTNPVPVGFAHDNTGRFNPGLLTYDIDYAEVDTLLKIPTSPRYDWSNTASILDATNATALAAVLARADGLPWVYNASAKSKFNIYNGMVVYNGPVEDYVNQLGVIANGTYGLVSNLAKLPRTNQRFVLVMVMSGVDTAGNSNLTNDPVFIHYGGEPDVEQPDKQPLHHWPLNGTRRNIGTDPTHPEFAARGRFVVHDNTDENSLLVDSFVDGGGGGSMLGADLAADRDFTIIFTYAQDKTSSNHPANAFQLWRYKGGDPAKTAGRQVIQGYGQILMLGTAELSRMDGHYLPAGWPHWHTYAITRRGNWWYWYADGVFIGVARRTHEDTAVYNAIYALAGYAPVIKNFRYYDYALSGKQIRNHRSAALSGTERPRDSELPEPLHRWPLNNSLVNKGRDTTPLANIFTFRKVAAGKDVYWAGRAGGHAALGVSMDASVDFTMCWDYFTSDAALTWCGFLGGPVNDSSGHAIKYYGTTPFIEGGGGDNAQGDPIQLSPNMICRIQMRRRNGFITWYINGQYLKSQIWQRNNFMAYTHFGYFSEALKAGISFRNLTYYDVALSDDQLLLDTNKDWS